MKCKYTYFNLMLKRSNKKRLRIEKAMNLPEFLFLHYFMHLLKGDGGYVFCGKKDCSANNGK